MVRNAKRKDGVQASPTDHVLANMVVFPIFVLGMMYRHVENQLSLPQLAVCWLALVVLAWRVSMEISKLIYQRKPNNP